MNWRVEFHRDFVPEFRGLSESVQDEIAALVEKMRVFGPMMKRPASDTLDGSRFSNMKELRFEADNGVWRVAYAFDPTRKAILLVAGDKSGVSQKRFLQVPYPKGRRKVCGVPRRTGKNEEKKMKTSVPYEKILATFPPARKRKIKKRAAELIAEEFTLRDLRKAKQITQQEVAHRLSGRQVYVSRLERRADMKLSTLSEYVRALGGDLQLMVTFPGDVAVRLRDIGTISTRKRRNVTQKSKLRKSA